MDGRQLDRFARRFALSRRGAIKTLAAGVVGALTGSAGVATTRAAKPNAKTCKAFCDAAKLGRKYQQKCRHECTRGEANGLYTECDGNVANVCTSPSGPVCPDKTSDPQHCGSCNRACGSNQVCQNGTCVSNACGGAPERVCQDANGSFCCGEGELCSGGECVQCLSGTASWCVKPEACTGPGNSTDGSECNFPTKPMIYCTASCEYWEVAYVCLGDGDFAGRAACCTPGVDCPGCGSPSGGNDPGFVPCPSDVLCAGASPCTPPTN